jgi:hypothetical protein
MPVHDWTRVPAGLFHDFHQVWSVELRNALNRGLLPAGYAALVEQRVDGPEPDVIAVEMKSPGSTPRGQTAVLTPPRTRVVQQLQSDATRYAEKANRISIRHALGDVVAVIELVSPGNKNTRSAFRSFVQKAATLLHSGIHLLIVDLFPPSDRDPAGLHAAVCDELGSDAPAPAVDGPLSLMSYHAGSDVTAYLEPLAVGQALPDMPLFLTSDIHVLVPLETTYAATWEACPAPIREIVQPAVGL